MSRFSDESAGPFSQVNSRVTPGHRRSIEEDPVGYFVTGATGFIGRNLVELLLEREGTIYVLVREGSKGRLAGAAQPLGRRRRAHRRHRRRSLRAAPRRLRRGPRPARGRRRPPLPPRGDLRHEGERREPAGRERRGHPPHGPVRRRGRGRARPHGELDRRRRALQGHLARGHVRRGPGGRQPPVLPDQARVRGGRARRVPPAPGGSIARGSSSATPRPARWTRSTGRTTSSS